MSNHGEEVPMHTRMRKAMTQKRLTLKTLEARIDTLVERIDGLDFGIASNIETDLLGKIEDLREDLKFRLALVEDGLGGAQWKTQEGHARWIAILTTQHLESIQAGGFSKGAIYVHIADELARRKIDREYRQGKRTLSGPKPKLGLFTRLRTAFRVLVRGRV